MSFVLTSLETLEHRPLAHQLCIATTTEAVTPLLVIPKLVRGAEKGIGPEQQVLSIDELQKEFLFQSFVPLAFLSRRSSSCHLHWIH